MSKMGLAPILVNVFAGFLGRLATQVSGPPTGGAFGTNGAWTSRADASGVDENRLFIGLGGEAFARSVRGTHKYRGGATSKDIFKARKNDAFIIPTILIDVHASCPALGSVRR